MSVQQHLSSDEGWRRVQFRFALVYLAAGLAALLFIHLVQPTSPAVLQSHILLAVILSACLAGLLWRPGWLRGIAMAALAGSFLAVALRAWVTPPDAFPGTLDLAIYVAMAATLFISPRAGDLGTAAILLSLLSLIWLHPWLAWDGYSLRHLSNLMLVLAGQQLMLRSYWRSVQSGVAELGLATESLELHAAQAREMGQKAFSEVRSRVAELGAHIAAANVARATESVEHLSAFLAAQRAGLPQLPAPPALLARRGQLLELRSRIRGIMVLVLAGIMALAGLRNALAGGPTPAWAASGAALFSAAWWMGRRSPGAGLWAFRISITLNLCLLMAMDWSGVQAEPQMLLVNNLGSVYLIFVAGLLDSMGLSAVLLALELAALAAFQRAGADIGVPITPVCLGLAVLGAWTLWSLPADLRRRLERQASELAEAVQHRRRLLCTLFHDLSNPLQTVSLLLESGEEPQRAQKLVERLRRVLEVAAALELAPVTLQSVDLSGLVLELAEQHRDRLRAKGLQLSLRGDAGAALAQAELLRESVLGNLLGNAIKFAPLGSRVDLEAARGIAWVELRVTDQGPGVPATVLKALREGNQAPSQSGSMGEPGHGYGLSLAQDYLTQMGGDLSLQPAPGGGTVAIVRLRLA